MTSLSVHGVIGAIINIGGRGDYVHAGFLNISVANLTLIGVMVAVFIIAIALPFPLRKRHRR